MPGSVIVAGARTPIGKLSGALASFSAMDLGGFAIAAALERAGISPDQVDYVLMGQGLQAGQGQITARQAAVKGGIPMTVPANTINKVCLSGLNSIYLADQMIRAGDADIVVAGGMESMTQAPYLLPGARAGYRLGDGTLIDSMMYDGLTDSFDHIAMGLSTEQHNAKVGISRERQEQRDQNELLHAFHRNHHREPLHADFRVTKLISRPGTSTALATSRPARKSFTRGLSRTTARTSFSSAAASTSTRSRTLPSTCTPSSMRARRSFASSYSGQVVSSRLSV